MREVDRGLQVGGVYGALQLHDLCGEFLLRLRAHRDDGGVDGHRCSGCIGDPCCRLTVLRWLQERGLTVEKKQNLIYHCDYTLRVHIYQGRNLPSADPNGLSDPFLKVPILQISRRCYIHPQVNVLT